MAYCRVDDERPYAYEGEGTTRSIGGAARLGSTQSDAIQ